MQQTVNLTDFIFDIAIRGVLVRLANLASGIPLSVQIAILTTIAILGIVVLRWAPGELIVEAAREQR